MNNILSTVFLIIYVFILNRNKFKSIEFISEKYSPYVIFQLINFKVTLNN